MKSPVRIALIVAVLGVMSPLAGAEKPVARMDLDGTQEAGAEQSLADVDKAEQDHPRDPQVYYQRAYSYMRGGFYDKAIADLEQAVQLNPRYKQAYYRLGFVYMLESKADAAVTSLDKVVEIDPAFVKGYYRRGNALLMKGDYDRAIADFDKVTQLEPKNFAACQRGALARMVKGDYAAAVTDLMAMSERFPQNPGVYNRLAWLRATCPNESFRDGKQAVELATKACELSGWHSDEDLDTLAAACAQAGDFPAAVKWQTQIEGKSNSYSTIAAERKSRLELYKSSRPYHAEKYTAYFEMLIK